MKTLRCEMCDSTDLVKEDGLFVCQYCGTKYSVEEAKKLMIEGTVDVTGSTVKVDNTAKLDNLYKLARRAVETNNAKGARSYYESILVEEPNSWEATLFTAYFGYIDTELSGLQGLATRMINSAGIVLEQIKKNLVFTEYEDAICQVSRCCDSLSIWICKEAERLHQMQQADYTENTAINRMTRDRERHIENHYAATKIMYTLGDYIEYFFGDDEHLCLIGAAVAWNCGIDRHNQMIRLYYTKDDKEEAKEEMLGYVEKIRKYNSSYQAPEIKTSGCYIATAVYGSYDCPQVWTLRRFRDNILAETWGGRLFIKVYYAISPTVVVCFGRYKWFNRMWRGNLDCMVKKLNADGIEDTPYEDRTWK